MHHETIRFVARQAHLLLSMRIGDVAARGYNSSAVRSSRVASYEIVILSNPRKAT